MDFHVKGPFEVKLAPVAAAFEESQLGRMSIDKRFSGELDAGSRGEMLAYRTAVEGSAGYVAMERVTGTLGGRSGSFVMQHSGTMNRGARSLACTVVPDSGAGELRGLSGAMDIVIEAGGKHFYDFRYSLPDAP